MISLPKQTLLAIDVVIIGGSLAGLACAIALRRVGHRVLILEKNSESELGISGGCRLPPNMTKILFSWGLEEELRLKALTSETIQLSLYNTGEIIGTHLWEEEVLKETGGDYIFMHYTDLRRILCNSAISHGAQIRYSSEVVFLDPDNRRVKLASGEIVRGDVIIAADGPFSLARQDIVGKQNGDVEGVIGALTMYNAIVPSKEMKRDPDLFKLQENASLYVWLGDGRCTLGFPVGKEGDFAFHLYVPSEKLAGSWGESAPLPELRQAVSPCEPILHKLVQRASVTARMTVREYQPQDSNDAYDWVHDSGRMLIIGEAAHPYPTGSIQSCAMAIEDGAVLAKLFSHLTHDDQVGSFLWAFQDLRQARCESARQEEMGHLFYMTMPPGTMQEERDRELRSRYAAGISALSGGEGGTADQWEGIKVIFGYDAEDEADNWWVQWGLLREWAKGRSTRNSGCGYIDFSSPN